MAQADRLLVLVVEDNDLVRWAVEEALKEAGYASLSVTTGNEAISEMELDITRFSAVLTDIRMPGRIAGCEVANRCRELSPRMLVIYMTGDPSFQWTVHGVPGSILLQKPFTDSQLNSALAKILHHGA